MGTISTIKRSDLLDVAEHITTGLPWVEHEAIMDIAQSVERIAAGSKWWDEAADCGCLVGTYIHQRYGHYSHDHVDEALTDAGVRYVLTLRNKVRRSKIAPIADVLMVID